MHYKTSYFENDHYRMQRLHTMNRIEKTQSAKQNTTKELMNNLFHSAFKNDCRFMIRYMAVETRDRLDESRHLVDHLFFDKIFRQITSGQSDGNVLQAYQIVCNLLMDDKYRAKLRDGNPADPGR